MIESSPPAPHPFSLTGRTALVTGASGGLGREIAKALAAAGAFVLVNGRNSKTLVGAVAAIEAAGGRAAPLPFDVADETAATAAMVRAAEVRGALDILVNTVGVRDRRALLIIAICTGVLWSGPAGADETDAAVFRSAVAAYKRGDYAEAVDGLRILADYGDAKAQSGLAAMYVKGLGVPQDHAEAVKWFGKAAEQGFASAQYDLGAMYGNGRGVAKDYVRAHMWFSLAAAQGDEMARKSRDIAAKLMTPAQIAEAQSLAREWKPKK